MQSLFKLLATVVMMASPSAAVEADTPPILGALPSTLATFITSPDTLTTPATGNPLTSFPVPFARPSAIDDTPDTAPAAATSDSSSHSAFNQGTDNDEHAGLLNYYFVFLVLFIVLAFLGAYFLNRRRLRQRRSQLARGQNALRSDIQGSTIPSNAMRWSRREESRRVEGLNEQGEAPPAYVKEVKGGSVVDGVAIPMGVLMRDAEGRERKPPDYRVAVSWDPMVHWDASERGQAWAAAEASRREANNT